MYVFHILSRVASIESVLRQYPPNISRTQTAYIFFIIYLFIHILSILVEDMQEKCEEVTQFQPSSIIQISNVDRTTGLDKYMHGARLLSKQSSSSDKVYIHIYYTWIGSRLCSCEQHSLRSQVFVCKYIFQFHSFLLFHINSDLRVISVVYMTEERANLLVRQQQYYIYIYFDICIYDMYRR